MSYINLNNPANFQLQEFEQLGFRYIVSGRPSIGGETYRTLFVLEAAVVTTTSPEGDSLSSETLAAGTLIHGFFSDVSTTSGALLAYKAGPITAQEIYDFYRAYVEANGGVIEGESCAVTEIAALLAEGLYSMASLVLIPSGYKTGVVYSERPTTTDGQLTFTRNSDATRVNSEGLVEKVRTNLLTYSNTFSNAAWSKILSTVTSGQEGYDGTNNAWLLQITDPAGRLEGFPFLSNLVTLSVYAKAGTTNVLTVTQLNSNSYVTCDLSNGTFTGQGGDVVYRDITSVGSGWYRIQLASRGTTLTGIKIAPVGVSGDNVYIQDIQLEYGDIATDYIPTTTSARSTFAGITVDGTSVPNVPRLDYSGGATCPSLLLEPQRTNLALYSEQFDNAAWTKLASTITANVAVSPSGYQDADNWVGTSANLFRGGTTGVEHTISIYAKSNGQNKDKFKLRLGNTVSAELTATSEWQRFSFTGTPTTSVFGLTTSASPNNEVDILVWGAQIEAESYPTSYIPTLGASVTRLADTAYKTDIAGTLPTAYPFTLFAEFEVTQASEGQALTFSNSSSSTQYFTIDDFGGFYRMVSRPFTTISSATSTISATLGFHKICGVFTSTTLKLFVDGELVASGANPEAFNASIDDIFIGQLRSVTDTGNRNSVKQALVFKSELTDAQAIELTTL